MKKIIFILLLAFVSNVGMGQENYSVPKDYKFSKAADYKTYEPKVKETIEWLLTTSMSKDPIKRQNANKFLMAWLTGTPDVSINIQPDVVNFLEKNGELLIPFMGGWVKYSLRNNYSKDILQGNKAGIEAMVDFYNKNRSFLQKDKNVEKYEKLIEKKELERYLDKIINKE